MKTKLITALRATAHALENGTFAYDWSKRSRCNCGALFCALTGMSATQLREKLPSALPSGRDEMTWGNTIGHYCTITGIPTHDLLKDVMAHGLTHQDIVELENLTNPKVVERMIRDNRNGLFAAVQGGHLFWKVSETPDAERANQKHTAAYMRAWADIMTEEGAMDVGAPEAKPVEQAA